MSPRSSIDKDDVQVIEKDVAHLEAAANVIEIDTFRVLGLSSEDADFYTNFPEEKRKKVFRKVGAPRLSDRKV